MTKLFVGGLPFATSEEELRSLFTAYGPVESANLISNRDTGQSRGFGFVELSDDAQAKNAISALNGSTVGSRQIVVNVAKPMERRDDRGGRPSNRW